MKRAYIFHITLAVAFISLTVFFIAVLKSWFGEPQGVGDVFCEAPADGFIKQPANTFSNFAFIIAGLVIAWQLSKDVFSSNRNTMTRSVFTGTFFSCLVVLLGPGSMALHATTTSAGGFFDMLSMYLIASFITAYAVQRFFKWQARHFALIFFTVLGICLWAHFQTYKIIFDYFGNAMFAFFIGLTTLFETMNHFIRKMRHERIWGLAALATLLISLLIWNLTKTDALFCDPDSIIQGHAIWHILDAVAVYLLFRFYVSEQ